MLYNFYEFLHLVILFQTYPFACVPPSWSPVISLSPPMYPLSCSYPMSNHLYLVIKFQESLSFLYLHVATPFVSNRGSLSATAIPSEISWSGRSYPAFLHRNITANARNTDFVRATTITQLQGDDWLDCECTATLMFFCN